MRKRLVQLSANQNILLPQGENMRLVTHLNINDDDLNTIVEVFQYAV